MGDYEEKKDIKAKDLTVSRVMADFKAAAKTKSKLTTREIEDFKYALGDQWSDEDKATLEKAKIKPATDNQIAPNLYLLTGLERQNRTDFKAFPEGEEDGLKAEIASYLFKKSIETSGYGDKSSEQFKDGITCGESHLELYLDNEDNLLNGKPRWKKLDGCQVFPDPASREYDFSDARYLYKVTRDIDKEDVISLYPEKEKEIREVSNGKLGLEFGDDEKHVQGRDYPGAKSSTAQSGDVYDGECVDLVERYYKKSCPHSFIGDRKTGAVTEAESQEKADKFISDYKASIVDAQFKYQESLQEARMMAAVMGQPVQEPVAPPQEDPERYLHIKKNVQEIWLFAFIPGMPEPLANERAWFYPKWKSYPIIPFYARFSTAPLTGDDRHLLVQGLVHGVKNAQDRHNKATTLMIRHLNSSVNSGWLSEEDVWVNPDEVKRFGTTPGVNLEYKAGRQPPQRISPAPLSSAHAEISKDALEKMKTSLGINADLLAVQQGGSDSGRAIALRQKQGLLMVQELFDNLSRSRKVAGRFVLSQLGKIFDTETAKKVLGDAFLKKNFPPLMLMNAETMQQEPMTDKLGNPMPYDKEMAELAIAEVLSGDLGSYDVSVGEAVSSETLRMANTFELKEIATAYPGVISPELIIEESQLPQSTKSKILNSIKNARMAQPGPMGSPIAG
ncbi:MAG: hypothetical protein E6Q97_27160 [Desulfurellales bacterium]|nr:MAG: hypothetical protein E6Q97_27160 [Desulfurellales bacterium]